ncbi:hypothetical protein HDU76_010463 [Blyttiomyces sp. JEL0837]|nr:hypothetical protein HDU76_010463 [Blyttiomyces sp. JEL0837]
MVEYMEFAKENLAGKVSIGLSTGDILFSSLGTERRRDVVNVAARLMFFDELQTGIIVDDATHLGSFKLFKHTNIGDHKIKGKRERMQLWTITKDYQTGDLRAASTDEVCGYENERKDITNEYKKWYHYGSKVYVLIEGVSGAGKSKLGSFTMNLADRDKVPFCLVQGTEIEQRTRVVYFIFSFFKDQGHDPSHNHQSNSLHGSTPAFVRRNSVSASSQIGSLPQQKQGSLNFELVTNFMIYHQEDPNLAPLLQSLLPGYTIPETNVTRALDPQAKSNLQKSIVFRLFNSFVSKHKCVFIFDDCQWFDEQSLEGILTIVKLSVKAFILILSRPIKDIPSDPLQSLSNHHYIKRLVLPGLSKVAVQEIIARKFASSQNPIVTIEDRLLEAIVSKGSSFPLYANMIGSLMQDMIGNELYVDDVGCLRLSDSVKDVDEILLTSVGAGITLQFDRLPQQFQEILRIASCLGQVFDSIYALLYVTMLFKAFLQYFNLVDLIGIGEMNITPMNLIKLIKDCDRYNFLELSVFDLGTTDNETDNVYDCSFRHISIMNAIYELLPYSERISVNLTAARRLENLLTSQNEDVVLPAMSFHYSRTMEFEKNISCMERLGYKYVDRCAFPEGTQILTKVEDFFKTLGAKDAVTIDPCRRARWLAEIAWAISNMKLTQKALSSALQSLDLITSGTWPHDERALKKKFIASLARLTKLWIITGGGKLTCRFLNKQSQPQKGTVKPSDYNHIDIDAIRARCFSSIALAALYDQKLMPALVGVSAIELLCNAIVQAPQNISQWRSALARCSFMFQFTLEPLARICFDKLVSIEEMEPKTFAHHLQLGILSVTVRAKAEKATEFLYSYLRWCEQRGDVFGVRASHVMLGFLAIRTCNPLGPIEDVLTRLSLDSADYDRMWTPTALAVRCVQNLMMFNLEMVANLIVPIREIVPLLTATVPAGVSTALYLDAYATLFLHGNGRESLQLLSQAIANARRLDRIFTNTIEIMWLSSLFIWIYIDFERLGILKIAPTSETDYVYQWDLMNAVEDSQKLMYFLGVKKGIIPCWWALHLFEVASDVIKGDTALVARKLSKWLTTKRRNEIVQIELLLAMYYGVIARYSDNREVVVIFKTKARQLFERGNADLFLRWLG